MVIKSTNYNIIIIQAAADVIYALDIYNKSIEKENIIVVIINVHSIFTFIKSLKLKISKLIFVPYTKLNLYNPFSWYFEKQRLKKLYINNFLSFNIQNVYFFSKYEDWLTGCLIHFFSKRNNITIFYCPYYDNSENLHKEINITIKKKIFVLILKYITEVKYIIRFKNKYPEFPITNYKNINTYRYTQQPIINNNILHKINNKNNYRNAVFFLSTCDNNTFNIKSFNKTISDTINLLLSNKYNVYLKGHPRLDMPTFLNSKKYNIINNYIPSEFISTNNINIFIGIESYSLCFFAKQDNKNFQCISLINLIETNDIVRQKFFQDYLIMNSNNNIKFVDSYKTLNRHLEYIYE